ncbi:MAG: hypothetical protein AB7E47_13050 [Desulfovibrionaceae bacterium]
MYLDTSDFSTLYKLNLTTEERSVKNFLINCVEEKKIIIPNSFPLMVEFIQNFSNEYKQDRLDRALLIKKLCGNYAFQYIPVNDNSQCLNDRGVWTPPNLPINIDKIIIGLSKAWKGNPQTAQWAKDLINPGRRIQLAQKHRELFTCKLTTEEVHKEGVIGKICEGEDVLYFLLKKISRKDFQRKIEKIINDPESYVLDVHGYRPILTEMMQQFHDVASTIRISIESLEAALAQHKEKLEELSKTKKQLLSSNMHPIEKNTVKQILKNFKSQMDTGNLASRYCTKLPKMFPKYCLDVLDIYIKEHLLQPSRNWNESDFGDIIHSLFIPHSNLWRGDTSFCNLMLKNDIRFKERVVPKLLDLPSRIENYYK